jgi:hypothetical protein
VIHAASQEEAERLRNEFLRARGMDWDALDDGTRALVAGRLVVGGDDAVGERVQALIGLGLDGLTFNLPVSGHDPASVAATVEVMVKAVS